MTAVLFLACTCHTLALHTSHQTPRQLSPCRHRLVVPKYNPARTFTQEGTVGLGGAYLCIYPMDSPGGYQLVGRTLPIWNTWGRVAPFTPDAPWLLRIFDQAGQCVTKQQQCALIAQYHGLQQNCTRGRISLPAQYGHNMPRPGCIPAQEEALARLFTDVCRFTQPLVCLHGADGAGFA